MKPTHANTVLGHVAAALGHTADAYETQDARAYALALDDMEAIASYCSEHKGAVEEAAIALCVDCGGELDTILARLCVALDSFGERLAECPVGEA